MAKKKTARNTEEPEVPLAEQPDDSVFSDAERTIRHAIKEGWELRHTGLGRNFEDSVSDFELQESVEAVLDKLDSAVPRGYTA